MGGVSGTSTSTQEQSDVRPVAIVHGKKNRLALGHDDEVSVSTGIKRVCISNDRESSPHETGGPSTSRFNNNIVILGQQSQHHNQPGHSRESSLDSMADACEREDCNHSPSLHSKCKHSSSAPDLRPGQLHNQLPNHIQGIENHSNESSPSPSNASSVLTQILSHNNNQHNLLHHSPLHTIGSDDTNYYQICSPNSSSKRPVGVESNVSFQYTLGAATSVATKVHEETMTYLNQGQSYEIKLRKSSSSHDSRNIFKRVRSVIRVGFHERRLQFMESELIDQWKEQRHLERILEVDIPLSYGISQVINDPVDINKCSFLWDTTKETGIFIKVNCISTEFTPKKHGGEKGVPFRVIIETHALPMNTTSSQPYLLSSETLLHAASSQVKVFKPKGADRKHKTDREKLSKKGINSLESVGGEKYRPAYDYTVFTDCNLEQFYSHMNSSRVLPPSAVKTSPERKFSTASSTSNSSTVVMDGPLDFTNTHSRNIIRNLSASIASTSLESDIKSPPVSSPLSPQSQPSRRRIGTGSTITSSAPSPPSNHERTNNNSLIPIPPSPSSTTQVQLRPDSTTTEATQFLLHNRFDRYLKIFANYSGSDLLRLSRVDLTQLCEETDGIRLYNCLHHHPRRHPRCTIYVSLEDQRRSTSSEEDHDFSAVFLESLTEKELRSKLGNLLSTSSGQYSNQNNGDSCSSSSSSTNTSPSLPKGITKIRMKGPHGISITVTDDFVQNMHSESMFIVDFEKGM